MLVTKDSFLRADFMDDSFTGGVSGSRGQDRRLYNNKQYQFAKNATKYTVLYTMTGYAY